MNMAQILDVLGWCDPKTAEERGNKCGRPPKGEHHEGVARDLRRRIRRDKGFTYHVASKNSPKTGFALSIRTDTERIINAKQISTEKIKNVLREYAPILKSEPRAHVGGWYDPNSKKVFFDVSIVVPNKEEALTLATKHKQLAIFDLEKGETIETGVKRIVAATEKRIRFDFDRDTTAEEMAEFLAGLGEGE